MTKLETVSHTNNPAGGRNSAYRTLTLVSERRRTPADSESWSAKRSRAALWGRDGADLPFGGLAAAAVFGFFLLAAPSHAQSPRDSIGKTTLMTSTQPISIPAAVTVFLAGGGVPGLSVFPRYARQQRCLDPSDHFQAITSKRSIPNQSIPN
jgi:hypothetical protein